MSIFQVSIQWHRTGEILCLLVHLLLILIRLYQKRKGVKRGDGTFGYMVWYGATRFWIEKFRTDSLMIGPLRQAQVISIVIFIAALLAYGVLRKKYPLASEPAESQNTIKE